MLPPRAITISDDRGTPVPLWSAQGTPADADGPADLRARVTALMTDRVRGWTRQPITRASTPVVLALAVLVTTPPLLTLAFGVRSPYAITVMMGGLFAVVIPLWMRAVQRGMAGAVRATLLAEGRCASCGYSMRGLTAEADGCAVCPECAAAWRFDPAALEARPPDEEPITASVPAAPGEIAQDRAARRQLRETLTALGVRRSFAALDASGRIVSLASPDAFATPPPAWGSLTPQQRRKLRSRWRRLGVVRRVVLGALLSPFVVYLLYTQLTRLPPSPLADPLAFLSTISLIVVWPMLYLLFVSRPRVKSGQVLVDMMLKEGHCPSCAAALAGLPIDDRGVVLCSACRASWDVRGVVPGLGAAWSEASQLSRPVDHARAQAVDLQTLGGGTNVP